MENIEIQDAGMFRKIICNTIDVHVVEMWCKKSRFNGSSKTKYNITLKVGEYLFKVAANTLSKFAGFYDLKTNDIKKLLKQFSIPIAERITTLENQIHAENKPVTFLCKIFDVTQEFYVYNIVSDVHQVVTRPDFISAVQSLNIPEFNMQTIGGVRNIPYFEGEFAKKVIADNAIETGEETFRAFVYVKYGDNTSENAFEIGGYIQVGSCANSILPFAKYRTLHTINWREHLTQKVQMCVTAIRQAVDIIVAARDEPLTGGQAIKIINEYDFGLDTEKEGILKQLLRQRYVFERRRYGDTRWALSQALSASVKDLDQDQYTERISDEIGRLSFTALSPADIAAEMEVIYLESLQQ
jgi:hypothetical protein